MYLIDVADSITSGPILYGKLVRTVLGKNMAIITDSFLAMGQIFICVAYVKFFG